jgi:non-heme chloroperoxidase
VTPEPVRVAVGGGLNLSLVDQGDPEGPVVVLLPGLTDSWRTYEPVLLEMPADTRVLAVSQRGHGESDRPQSGFRPADYASDVAGLLDALGVERAVIAGHSSAGLTVQRFAIDNPARTAGLVLEGAFPTLRGEPAAEVFLTSLSDLQDPIDPAFVRQFQGSTVSPYVSQATVDALVEDALRVPARVWRETFASLLEEDYRSALRSVDAPALVVWGDRDELVARTAAEALVEALPHGELLVYEGIGHTPHLEAPGQFAADLHSFAQRVAASRG